MVQCFIIECCGTQKLHSLQNFPLERQRFHFVSSVDDLCIMQRRCILCKMIPVAWNVYLQIHDSAKCGVLYLPRGRHVCPRGRYKKIRTDTYCRALALDSTQLCTTTLIHFSENLNRSLQRSTKKSLLISVALESNGKQGLIVPSSWNSAHSYASLRLNRSEA